MLDLHAWSAIVTANDAQRARARRLAAARRRGSFVGFVLRLTLWWVA